MINDIIKLSLGEKIERMGRNLQTLIDKYNVMDKVRKLKVVHDKTTHQIIGQPNLTYQVKDMSYTWKGDKDKEWEVYQQNAD
jgi:hypothetical protein